MSLIAEFEIDSEEFLLGQRIANYPDLTVAVERVVPAGKQVMPYLWVYGKDQAAFESELREDEQVQSLSVLDRLPDAALYRISWEVPAERLITDIAELQATILDVRGDDTWTFKIRFETHGGLALFRRLCESLGIEQQLVRVAPLTDIRGGEQSSALTRPQYETLREAVERGYFKVPREVTFAELADELGISEQAVSERVRRGADTVLRIGLEHVTLADQSPPSDTAPPPDTES